MPGALGGLSTLGDRFGVLGGALHAAGARLFGWMLAPAGCGPLPFELAPIVAPARDARVEAAIRGNVDVVAPGMLLVDRRLLLEPLPADPVAAALELCARARAAGREVLCRPSFGCTAPALDPDDRGRSAALRAIAEARPELVGHRVRVRVPLPPLCVLVHGPGAELAARRARDLAPRTAVRVVDDPAAALRAEMRMRGDRYLLLADGASLPDAARYAKLVEALEAQPYVAVSAPDAAALDGRCVLLALGRFPQHVTADGATLSDALATLTTAASALRRAVRAPGYASPPVGPAAPRRATIVFLAASLPEIMRLTLDAVVPAVRVNDELVAVCAQGAQTTRRILAAYPQLRIETDAADPLLTDGANRALGAAERELIVLVADDVLVPAAALDRLRDAFGRIPALGAAFPVVPGATGGEGVTDVTYADLTQLHTLAERRRAERAHRLEPIDSAVTPVLAVAREALHAVGGIDPAFGPTRRGIADLVAKLRAAGYPVVRCDDALVHRFDAALSHNPAAAAGTHQRVAAADPACIAAGFDPLARIPFGDAPPTARARDRCDRADRPHAVAVPVAGAAELDRAVAFLAAVAAVFDAGDPIRVHLLLDGDVSPADAVARVRPVLAAAGRPLDETVAVRIERVADLSVWRSNCEAGQRVVVAAGYERDALDGLRAVDARALGDLLEPALS